MSIGPLIGESILLNLFYSILIYLSALTYAVDVAETVQNEQLILYNKEINESLVRLKSVKAEDYFKDIDTFRTDLEKYFDHKKRVCEGEFSTIILGKSDKNKLENHKVKLSKDERKLCFREIKALQVTFVNNMFIARKRHLEHLHTKRMDELSKAREASIKSLRSSFDRKR